MHKEIVGLHSPLHTIHYISKTSQPDYGRRSKRKIPKQHKATGQERILVEEPLLTVETSQANSHKLHRAPSEELEPAPASNSAEPATGVVK